MPVLVQSRTRPNASLFRAPRPLWFQGLVCGCITVAAILCAYPVAEMGFFDDWSYVKTAFEYARTGHFVFNGWGAMMLGWQVPWAALFVKAFGYSFTAVRASMLPVDFVTVWLFHAILVRFGISRSGARFGALTLGLSPLFIPLGASYLTDVTGLFAILLCLYLCLRALDATTENAALAWLCVAAATNVLGGTARQIAWVGALVLVPSTAWLLRRMPHMIATAAALWIGSAAGIAACLRWWYRQPYSVPERMLQWPIHPAMLVNVGQHAIRSILCLAFLVFPLLWLWLPQLRGESRRSRVAMVCFAGLGLEACFILPTLPRVIGLPWLQSIVAVEFIYGANDLPGPNPFAVSRAGHVVVSVLVILLLWLVLQDLAASKRQLTDGQHSVDSARWLLLLGPFSVAYTGLLLPRAVYSVIYDRYLLGFLPIAILILMRLYQSNRGPAIPRLAYLPLVAIAGYSVASTHDLFALNRARLIAVREVRDAGVPAYAVQAGFEYDGLNQVNLAGYVNFPDIKVPQSAYKPDITYLTRQPECRLAFDKYFSALKPEYQVVFARSHCGRPSGFPPVSYTTWLAPRHRTLEIVQVGSAVEPRR